MAYDFANFKKQVEGITSWLEKELSGIRTGRATVTLLDAVLVESYGVKTPLNQTANISVEDPKTIRITPWDKGLVTEIEKGIAKSDLGVSTSVDSSGVRVIFPDLTTENREKLVKISKGKVEEAKITLRGERSKVIRDIENGKFPEDDEKRYKDEIQKMVDGAGKRFDELEKKKEKEISS